MGELASRPADLPDALIRFSPDGFQVIEHRPLHLPGVFVGRHAMPAGQMEGADHLAEDVELELPMRGIADANGPGALVARQPIQFEFLQAPFAGQAVHDVELRRRAGDSPQEPVLPGLGFVEIASLNQGVKRERGVADPTVAVVPVPHAADFFRKRCRRCRQDAARRRVGQGLQGNQRAHDRFAPRSLVGALGRPFLPPLVGLLNGRFGVDALRARFVEGVPHQD